MESMQKVLRSFGGSGEGGGGSIAYEDLEKMVRQCSCVGARALRVSVSGTHHIPRQAFVNVACRRLPPSFLHVNARANTAAASVKVTREALARESWRV